MTWEHVRMTPRRRLPRTSVQSRNAYPTRRPPTVLRLTVPFCTGGYGLQNVGESLDDERPSMKLSPHLRWAVAGGVFLAATVLLVFVFAPRRSGVQPISGSGILEVPPVGGVVAANLPDGRPVFVVHHADGTVNVVDAFSTHVTYGIGKLAGWCPSSRTFEDPFHGSKWDEFGDYALGPAPTGLVTYQFSVVPGDQNQVQVDGAISSHPRGFLTQPFQPAGPFCESTSRMVLPDVLREASSSPADVVAAAPTGWVGGRGVLLATAGRPARLCAAVADGVCADAAPVPSVDVTGLISALRGPRTSVTIEGPRIAQVRAGAFVLLTRVPRV
jgi:hypothetical protein